MSLTGILNSASSGLSVAQTQIRTISDNVANVNTPGYARRVVDQTSAAMSALGGGVQASRITRAVDQFLAQAGLLANAQAGGAGAVSDMMDRAQGLFGDPTTDSGYFNQLDRVFSAFAASAQDPASSVSRSQALDQVKAFLDRSTTVANGLTNLAQEADSRIGDTVSKVNDLLSQIDQLNKVISSTAVGGADTTGAENSQAQLIDQLSSMLDVTISTRPDHSIDVRGASGTLLVGQSGAAQLSYAAGGSSPGQILVAPPGGSPRLMLPSGGQLKGLLDLRNTDILAVSAQLGEYVTRAVDEINRAHNASSAVPPPATLTGRNTGLDLPTAVSGFTGKTTVAIVDPSGVMQSRVDIDFSAGTMSVDGGAPSGFTPATFLASLNGALGANGSASFSSGALSISATGSNGVSIADDPTTPSSKAGKGFSHFFGLNDLITSTGYPYAATGLQAADPNGFNAGGVMTLRLTDASGAPLRDVAVPVPFGGSVGALVTALNDPTTGIGLYGQFSLDSQGQMTFSASRPGITTSVVSDTSQRGAGGPSVTALFGLNSTLTAQRAARFSLRTDIAADNSKLSQAQLDLSATAGQPALSKGDSRGGLLLAAAGDATANFLPAGAFGALNATLSQYAAQFSGAVAQSAATADTAKSNAEAISSEAATRRASVEGVNLDQELVNLTTYQQAYGASARLIQAVSDLYDILLKIQ